MVDETWLNKQQRRESSMDSLDYMVVISAVVLGLSVLATLAKFFDWFIHSDPATMVRTTRWLLLLLLAICVPILIAMIVQSQWSGAMLLAAAMLIIPTLLKWRAVFAPLRVAFSRLRRKPHVLDMEIWDDDIRNPETVRRAAAILEAYVNQAPQLAVAHDGRRDGDRQADEMSEEEALEVLGLKPGADEAAIRAAHRRLMRLVHPDHSGSTYLSRKVSQAKDTLLPGSRKLLRPFTQHSGN
jgi:hypothetical protein